MDFVRSSFCANHSCVEAAFVASSFCAGGTCVEAAPGGEGGAVLVRDGKAPDGPVLELTRAEWDGFLDAIRAGELDDL